MIVLWLFAVQLFFHGTVPSVDIEWKDRQMVLCFHGYCQSDDITNHHSLSIEEHENDYLVIIY